MSFKSLSAALADYFDTPLASVPEEVRHRIDKDFWPMPWDELESNGRKQVAEQWDLKHDPAYAEANARAWNLVCSLDEAKATAARLRAAADRTTGLEREANLRQGAEVEAEIVRVEDELNCRKADAAPTEMPHRTKIRPGRKPSDAPIRLRKIITALAEYAAETGQNFDPLNAPGPLGESFRDKGSLHWLCAAIDPVFKKAKTTFEKQRAGVCAVQPYAKKSAFYRQALPHIASKLGAAPNVR